MKYENAKKKAENVLENIKPRSFSNSIFNMANAYNQIGDKSLEMIAASRNADFSAPAIMCKSFAIELMLKYFISFNEHAKNYQNITDKSLLKGHKYTELFDKIPDEYKTIISKHFSILSRKEMTVNNFRNALIDIGDTPFVKWRYIYEENGINHLDNNLLNTIVESLGLSGMELEKKEDS